MSSIETRVYGRPASRWVPLRTEVRRFAPAWAVFAAARATPRPIRPPSVGTTLLEAALLLETVEHDPRRRLTWRNRYWDAPPHLQRFLTEACALAITVEAATWYGWTPAMPLYWFDNLAKTAPSGTPLSRLARIGRYRPDIAIEHPPGHIRALESRGRSCDSPPIRRPNAKQQQRIHQLDTWASAANPASSAPAAWGMVWAWLTNGRKPSQVDFFDPGEPVPIDDLTMAQLRRIRQTEDEHLWESWSQQPGYTLDRADSPVRVTTRNLQNDADDVPRSIAVAVSDPSNPNRISVRDDQPKRDTDDEYEPVRLRIDAATSIEVISDSTAAFIYAVGVDWTQQSSRAVLRDILLPLE